jgi:hypothetical protein
VPLNILHKNRVTAYLNGKQQNDTKDQLMENITNLEKLMDQLQMLRQFI